MPHKDFDAAIEQLERSDGDAEPVTFNMGGRTWTAAEIPDKLRLRFAAAGQTGRAAVMDQILDMLVVPEERADWSTYLVHGRDEETDEPEVDDEGQEVVDALGGTVMKRQHYPPPRIASFYPVVAWVIGEQSGRPTTPSQPSSNGRGGTGAPSSRTTTSATPEAPPS